MLLRDLLQVLSVSLLTALWPFSLWMENREMQAKEETLRRQVGVGLAVLARVLGRGLRTYSKDKNSYFPYQGSQSLRHDFGRFFLNSLVARKPKTRSQY